MKYLLLICFLVTYCFGLAQSKRKWKQLFNGKDLAGWHMKIRGHAYNENFGHTFRVENHKLKVVYDQYPNFNEQFGHIFYKTPYSYYIIGVEYRFVGKQAAGGPDWAFKNSGIMIHCQSPTTMLKDQDFPISIEVQSLHPRHQCGNEWKIIYYPLH